ncbi:hypothetical protein BH18ACI3_BH18ACI3_08040 [soil metagenome]
MEQVGQSLASSKRKVRTSKGNEPDNFRAFERSDDDKCNRKQTSLEKGDG